MNKNTLTHIWQTQKIQHQWLHTINGQAVLIHSSGLSNKIYGPDFIAARVSTKNITWIGNIAIHYKTSDWYAHKYHLDKAYNSVILYVVYINNEKHNVTNQLGEPVPTIELKKIYLDHAICHNKDFQKKIPCHEVLTKKGTQMVLCNHLKYIYIKKLLKKAKDIEIQLKYNNQNWEETLYQYIGMNFGTPSNQKPFQLLMQSIPFKILKKHKTNLHQIEALLFGQAGFLNDSIIKTSYTSKLKKEYALLSKCYDIRSLDVSIWTFHRLRPAHFPTIRLAQMAQLFYHTDYLFSSILDMNKMSDIKAIFSLKSSSFWDTHYTFLKNSVTKSNKKTGHSFIKNIAINLVVPFQFTYGHLRQKSILKNNAIKLIQNIPPEENLIIRQWKLSNVDPQNALQSQALIFLKKRYCINLKCQKCKIGYNIL